MGQPADDATAVPTNVVLHYAVPSGVLRFEDPPTLVPGEYVLQADTGALVELRVTRPSEHELEMVPAQALQPNTTYTLMAHWKLPQGTEADAGLIFETGNGPLDDTVPPPSALMRSYQLERDHTASCGPRRTDTCISVQDDRSLIEYTFIDAAGEPKWSRLSLGSAFLLDIAGLAPGSTCVELRRFSANGSRSQPLRLCAEDAAFSDLTNLTTDPLVSCSAGGLSWWDATGKRGCEPGPHGATQCAEDTSYVTSVQAGEITASTTTDAGAVPMTDADAAAPSCSALPEQPPASGRLMPFAMLATIGILHARSRSARRESQDRS